ncbi:MAG: hypothetical protein H6701_02580 [Myxococcales bacterium]|nr:hypothetical protein [Myxococcales bacterium]
MDGDGSPMSLWITAIVATVLALGWLLWRTGPILLGAARPRDGRSERIRRWNRFVVPLLRKMMDGRLLVARAQVFASRHDGRQYSIATWAMVPTVLPDVDYVALARPGGEQDAPEVLAVAEAPALRALLGDAVQSQVTWGHTTWLHVWPEEVDLDAVVARLVPAARFKATHGLDPSGAAPASD